MRRRVLALRQCKHVSGTRGERCSKISNRCGEPCAKLPWLNRALLGEAFKVLPDQINTLVNQGWLLASPETPDGLELDPSLQRLSLATLHPATRALEVARAWYAREGHKAEAIHCAVALGTPIDELAARALMGPGSAPNEKASVGSKARPILQASRSPAMRSLTPYGGPMKP